MFNNGDGKFKKATNYYTDAGIRSVFSTDLDADKDFDIAILNETNNILIFINNGEGTFQTIGEYLTTGRIPVSLFSADIDGDKDFDLVIANHSENISILLNNGNGTFQRAINYGAEWILQSVFCADLDGDTDLDLAVANPYTNDISIFENLTQISANYPPDSFSLLSPGDGDSIFDQANLRWQTVTDPNYGDQIIYEAYMSTSSEFHPDSTIIDSNLVFSKTTLI